MNKPAEGTPTPRTDALISRWHGLRWWQVKFVEHARDLERELAQAQETHIMQLAGISTASIQNTISTRADRIDSSNPYWSVAYGDVCRAIDREMWQRERAEAAEAKVAELTAQLSALMNEAAEHVSVVDEENHNLKRRLTEMTLAKEEHDKTCSGDTL